MVGAVDSIHMTFKSLVEKVNCKYIDDTKPRKVQVEWLMIAPAVVYIYIYTYTHIYTVTLHHKSTRYHWSPDHITIVHVISNSAEMNGNFYNSNGWFPICTNI